MRRRELRRRYAKPCRGYWSSFKKDEAPPGIITGDSSADSYNVLIDSQEAHLLRRRGIAYYGESDPTAQVGLLEAVTKNLSMNMLARHGLDVQYPSATPGSIVGPTYLYTDRDDTGHFGQIFGLTSTQGTRKVLGHEMGTLASPGTTHYPRSTASTRPNFRMIPLPYMAGGSGTQATGYSRCTFPLQRALVAGGSMKMYQAQNNVFWPSFHGTPGKWDRRSNPSTSTGTEQVHIAPWGHLTPLFAPALVSSNVTAGNAVWYEGDAFYLSVVFQMEDGSFSMPNQNRGQAFLSNRGLIVAGTFVYTSVTAFDSLTIRGIAIGPPGTKARLLCRTRKTNISDASAAGGVRPLGMTPQGSLADIDAGGRKLYVFAKINNNTQTTYDMVESNDDVLITSGDDPVAINFFYIWPLPARYCFEMERRAAVGYTRRQNPCAIILAPTGNAADYDLNDPEDSAAGTGTPYDIYAYCIRLFRDNAGTTTLQYRRSTIGAAGIVTGSVSITATKTVQDVMDEINLAGVLAGFGTTGAWAAQPAPGCDPSILASYLAPTAFEVTPCTLSTTSTITTTGSQFADVAIGMRLRVQSGTGTIPTNAVVIGKASDSSITIGTEDGATAVTTAGTASVQFWSDTGDDSWSSDAATWGIGNVRSFCGAFPMVLALKGSYLDSLTIGKQDILYTSASPGASALAPQSFFNSDSNRAAGPLDAGVFMGGAPVYPNAIAFFSDGIYSFKALRDTNTGEDRDFRLFPLGPKGLGVIQYGTIVSGRGWAGGLTREGFWVSDNSGPSGQAIISNPLFNPAHGGTGILGYQCRDLAAFNGVADLPRYQTAHAYVTDGTLRLTFTPNAALA